MHGSSDSAGDGDVEETPKASKMNLKGKKKAGNLKTSLGGRIGENIFPEDSGEDNITKQTPLAMIPSINFNPAARSTWADSWVEGGKTHMFVKCVFRSILCFPVDINSILKARSANDPLLARKSILDPYMLKHGYYKDLPNAK